MNNKDLIHSLIANSDDFSREELSEIIELASKSFFSSLPFMTEEELAEQTLADFVNQLSSSDRDLVSRAKKKVVEIIP